MIVLFTSKKLLKHFKSLVSEKKKDGEFVCCLVKIYVLISMHECKLSSKESVLNLAEVTYS